MPVSTTFLVLTVFAPTNVGGMLLKSFAGYLLAMAVGVVVYFLVARVLERRFLDHSRAPATYWVALQWFATAFLWSQWLVQDLANIFVYLPRAVSLQLLVFAVILMLFLHALIFYRRGGAIQQIVTSKTNTTDIRSATIIDFIYAFILLYFKQMNNVPMSTTWVFLGLLAGREFMMAYMLKNRSLKETGGIVMRDGGKALVGLAISLALAFGLPPLAQWMSGGSQQAEREAAPTDSVAVRLDEER